MLGAVRKGISRHNMILPGDMVVAAHSGGADSTCLLDVLARLRDELQIGLASAHFEHGIRGETGERDARFARREAERRSIEHFCGKGDVPALAARKRLSLEDAARRARHAFFETLPDRFPGLPPERVKIALGHTADDQAETVLMRLLRGSGPRGLSGIPPVRGMYIRPLIEIKRRRVIEYLESNGLAWVEDETNLSTDFLRNRIRRELLPSLARDYNPNLVETLSRAAAAMRHTADFMAEQAQALLGQREIGGEEAILPRNLVAHSHPALALALLDAAISAAKGDLLGLRSEHRMAILEGARGRGNSQIALPGGRVADIDSETVRIGLPAEPVMDICRPLAVPGVTHVDELGVIFESSEMRPEEVAAIPFDDPAVAHLDMEAIPGPWEARNFREGDRFQPLGMDGSRKLQDLFVDMKIPRRERRRVPIITAGGQIAWVAPYRLDHRFRVTPKTRKILRIAMRRA